MLSKSLIQFSVDGWGCVPSLLFDLRPSYGGGHEDNGHFPQKVPCINCRTQCLQPCSRPLPTTPPLGLFHTHRQVWVSHLWSQCSFLLGPGAHKVLFVPSKSLFPQSCVSSGGSVVGLTATSSKRAYAIPRPAAPRAPAPEASTADPYLCWRHSNSVSVGSPGAHKVLFEPSEHLWWVWDLILNTISPVLPSCWDFSFALGREASFFWWDPTFSC